MKLVIFGATGKAGRVVVAEALARGHEVVAFVHKTALPEQKGLTAVRGDVHDAASVARALAGCDAVISCLSSWGTPHKDVLTSATRYILPAMETNGVRRIITLTGNIALLPGEQVPPFLRFIHGFLTLVAPKVAGDAETHLQLLTKSSLDWTSLRSPTMVNGAPGTYRLTSSVSIAGTIPRTAIAAAMLDLAASRDWIHQAPIIRRA
jgi:putative NADH-flavin reductase